MAVVLVPEARLQRWFDNFARRHGAATFAVSEGALHAAAVDGSTATARLPFDTSYDGPAEPAAMAAAVHPPDAWGVLLVRKGGFAVARLHGRDVAASKVGRRHVQGRTKAGGQSQQRFARRRANQARQAYEAAAEHACRVLSSPVGERELGLDALVCGGDRSAVDQVVADPRLQALGEVRTAPWLAVPDPDAQVLRQAVADACSVQVTIEEA